MPVIQGPSVRTVYSPLLKANSMQTKKSPPLGKHENLTTGILWDAEIFTSSLALPVPSALPYKFGMPIHGQDAYYRGTPY